LICKYACLVEVCGGFIGLFELGFVGFESVRSTKISVARPWLGGSQRFTQRNVVARPRLAVKKKERDKEWICSRQRMSVVERLLMCGKWEVDEAGKWNVESGANEIMKWKGRCNHASTAKPD